MIDDDDQQVPDWAQGGGSNDQGDQGDQSEAVPDWARAQASQPDQEAQGQDNTPDWARQPGEGNAADAPTTGSDAGGVGSFAREALRAAPAGLAARTAGTLVGGAATRAIALAAAEGSIPFAGLAGPFAPVVPFVAGGLAAILAGAATSWTEDQAIAAMGFDDKQHQADQGTLAGKIGNVAGNVVPGGAVGAGAMIGARALGGGIAGGMSAAQQYVQNGSVDPTEVALNVAGGAAFPANSARLDKVLSRGFSYRGGNKNPDLKEVPPANDEAPAQEPAATEDEITVNNDVTTTAAGIAQENGPVPETQGIGNPGQAGGLAHEAARPSDAERDYSKDNTKGGTTEITVNGTRRPDLEARVNKIIDTETIPSDIQTALPGAEPTEQQGSEAHTQDPSVQRLEAGTDVLPPPEAAPTAPPAETPDAVPGSEPVEQAAPEQAPEPVPEATQPAAPLTPEAHKSLIEDRKALADAGYTKSLKLLDKLPPQEQAKRINDLANTARAQMAEAAGKKASEAPMRDAQGELRSQNRKKAETGALVADKGELARATKANAAYQSVYDKFGPHTENGKSIDVTDFKRIKETRGWAKDTWAAAKEMIGGDPFAKGSGHYIPKIKTPQMERTIQWLRALRQSAVYQKHQDFTTLHAAPDLAKLVGEGNNIDSAIGLRPQLPKAAEENETAVSAGKTSTGEDISREPIEPFHDPEQMESKVYGDQQGTLRKWVNDLDDTDYTLLKAAHPDLEQNVRTTQDPAELLQNLQDDMLEAQSRRPKGEISSEVELPAKQEAIPSLPSEPEVGSKAVSMEQERLAGIRAKADALRAQRIAMFAGKGKPTSPKARIAGRMTDEEATGGDEGLPPALDAKPKSSEETATFLKKPEVAKVAAKTSKDLDLDAAADSILKESGWKDLGDKVKEFVGNEEGSGKIPAWLTSRFSRNNPVSPAAHDAITDYVDSLGHEWKRHIGREKNIMMQGNAAIHAAPAEKQGMTPKGYTDIANAIQNRGTGSLNAKLAKVYDGHVVPLRDQHLSLAREVYKMDQEEFGGAFKFPDPDIQGPAKDFMPRRVKGEQMYDKQEAEKYDALSGRTLSVTSPSTMQREWMALHNPKTGARLTVQRGEDADGHAKYTVWRNGSPQVLKNVSPNIKGEVNDKINLTLKGQKTDWVFDHAANAEITAATAGRVQYHDNPIVMYTQAITDMAKNLNNMRLIKSIKEDPRWEANTTTSMNEARAKGYDLNPVDLEALGRNKGRQVYMPRELREALNDFFKKGFGGTELDPLRKASVNAYKTFFALSPFVHPLNVLDQTVVGRGWDNFKPSGVASLVRNLPRAIKSVNEHDYHQTNMNAFGGNPMLASVKIKNMWPDAARKFQMDLGNNPSKWDPIAKILDTTTPELGRQFAKASNDVTWRLSDYMATLRYLENLDKGHSIESAVREMHEMVPDYHIPTRVAGSRLASTILADPAFTSFGRFTYDRFAQLARMTRNTIVGTSAERNKALGQWASMAVLGLVLYPAADAALQKLSGNQNAKLSRRGATAVPQAVADSVKQKSINPALHLTTPSPAMSMLNAARTNQDWNGKPVVPEGVDPFTSPVRTGGYVGDYLARQYLAPYNTIGPALAKGQGVLPTIGHFAGEQVGAKFPSTRAERFDNQRDRRIHQQEKQRLKHGEPGVLPDIYDRITGRK